MIRHLAEVVVSVRDTDTGPRVELAGPCGRVVALSLTPSDAAVVGALLATTARSAADRPDPPPAR